MIMLIFVDKSLFIITQSDNVILHMLTGVKRVASDNTAISGTPSLDNYITLILHCFHSLLVILLKSSDWNHSDRETNDSGFTVIRPPMEPSPLHI